MIISTGIRQPQIQVVHFDNLAIRIVTKSVGIVLHPGMQRYCDLAWVMICILAGFVMSDDILGMAVKDEIA